VVFPSQFRKRCVLCDGFGREMNKEHFWPEWLIERTGTHVTSVRIDVNRRVNPKTFTVPLCKRCNDDLGRVLEAPMSRIFTNLESGEGISDNEVELLIRWLWKFEGIAWRFAHPTGMYTDRYTIRERVLGPLDDIREELTLAISLAETINPDFGDAPMGIDSQTSHSATYVAGVFSRVAVMVLLRELESHVPPQFSMYRLASKTALDRDAKLFFPKVGFRDCVQAVGVTMESALFLSYAHDLVSRNRSTR
jgi:hypothetical protein